MIYKADPGQGFDSFWEWCVDTVGGNKRSARGHFKHAGLNVEDL